VEETRSYCSESGYLCTSPENKKAGDYGAPSEQLNQSNNHSKRGQMNLRADFSFFEKSKVSFFVVLKRAKMIFKNMKQSRNKI